jgi:hypothetical protein
MAQEGRLPMLDHRTPLWRWLSWHRYQLTAAVALAGIAAALGLDHPEPDYFGAPVAVAPLLLAVSAVEWKLGHRRVLGLAILSRLAATVLWLWHELRGLPHGRWHSCVQCGAPIEAPSRAEYCSSVCRRIARLERERCSPDPWIAERAALRLRTLDRCASTDPALSEVPF